MYWSPNKKSFVPIYYGTIGKTESELIGKLEDGLLKKLIDEIHKYKKDNPSKNLWKLRRERIRKMRL